MQGVVAWLGCAVEAEGMRIELHIDGARDGMEPLVRKREWPMPPRKGEKVYLWELLNLAKWGLDEADWAGCPRTVVVYDVVWGPFGALDGAEAIVMCHRDQ